MSEEKNVTPCIECSLHNTQYKFKMPGARGIKTGCLLKINGSRENILYMFVSIFNEISRMSNIPKYVLLEILKNSEVKTVDNET